jgi:uncharacterized membrane protein YgcG
VPPGDPFTPAQASRIRSAIDHASNDTGLYFSVFVGDVDGGEDQARAREVAELLHAALGDAAPSSVLLLVAPGQRRVEIVTGLAARRRLPDRACSLATASMTSAFTGGDIAGGIAEGLRQLSSSTTGSGA